MDEDKKILIVVLASIMIVSLMLASIYAAVPADTLRTTAGGISTLVVDQINVTDTYFFTWNGTIYNLTEVVAGLVAGWNATDEWGLVYGTTGDWFNYTEITYTPVYLGLQMHPLNVTFGVIPQVYDKDNYHWQLALYWYNGSQYTKGDDFLVMYYAHVDWDNTDGLEYIRDNDYEPV